MPKPLIGHIRRRLSVVIIAYGFVLIGGLYLFAQLARKTYRNQGFWFDEPLLALLATHRTELLDQFFGMATWLGSGYVLIPIGMAILVVLLHFNYYTQAILLCIGFGGAMLITDATKFIIARHRPELFPHLVQPLVDYAFPSGHTTQIAAFVLCLFLIVRHARPNWQIAVGIIAVLLTVVVALSRLYLQVHYPSDVLGGLLLATLWILGVDYFLKGNLK